MLFVALTRSPGRLAFCYLNLMPAPGACVCGADQVDPRARARARAERAGEERRETRENKYFILCASHTLGCAKASNTDGTPVDSPLRPRTPTSRLVRSELSLLALHTIRTRSTSDQSTHRVAPLPLGQLVTSTHVRTHTLISSHDRYRAHTTASPADPSRRLSFRLSTVVHPSHGERPACISP